MMFRRVLIANRGEIACRVISTCRRLGIHSIAVHSEADRGARHVRLADEASEIGPPPATESYLDIGRILAAARATSAEAVHPGYGFLSENEDFAEACARAGIVFIGPTPAAIRSMGLKHEAKALVSAAGVPVVPGYLGEDQSDAALAHAAGEVGFPLLVKAVAGGGGKGMRVVRDASELSECVASARREAESAFGDGRVMLERFIERPRHIEVQVFGDAHGHHVHLFERECSAQRRYQKIIEEAPSPFVTPALRERITSAAVRAAAAVGYVNAGTVEFIVGSGGEFYFMEMNTRLQVEHPVTERITGLDLVEWQLRVAAGEPLPLTQGQVRACGHAIEARIYSEDPARGFVPAIGRVDRFAFPAEDDTWRVDRGVDDGDTVSVYYDPMIAKVIATGADRSGAVAALASHLSRTAVFGPATNLKLLRRLAGHPAFVAGEVDTGFIDRNLDELVAPGPEPSDAALLAVASCAMAARQAAATAASPWSLTDGWQANGQAGATFGLAGGGPVRFRARHRGHEIEIVAHGQACRGEVRPHGQDAFDVTTGGTSTCVALLAHRDAMVVTDGATHELALVPPWPVDAPGDDADTHPASPLPGRVVALHVEAGDRVEAGQPLAIIEGMKMQHTVRAGRAGQVTRVLVAAGQLVDAEATLLEIDAGGHVQPAP
jgi:3-methylcrotonyl-CoA carboxylase alpha subunit